MTQWGFVRVLAMSAAGFCAGSALMWALQGDTAGALTFGALAIWNTFMYASARGK